MKTPTIIHFKTLKWILWYIKGTVDFGLFYGYSNSFKLIGYSDSDWAGDMERALRVVFSTWEIQHSHGVQRSIYKKMNM
jgi:hypothetical protein